MDGLLVFDQSISRYGSVNSLYRRLQPLSNQGGDFVFLAGVDVVGAFDHPGIHPRRLARVTPNDVEVASRPDAFLL